MPPMAAESAAAASFCSRSCARLSVLRCLQHKTSMARPHFIRSMDSHHAYQAPATCMGLLTHIW